jgi:hypothetical protein
MAGATSMEPDEAMGVAGEVVVATVAATARCTTITTFTESKLEFNNLYFTEA